MPRHISVLAALAACLAPPAAHAQVLRDPGSVASAPADVNSPLNVNVARRAQADFERFRLENLPNAVGRRPTACDEQVGNVCYWYDEKGPPPPREPAVIRQHEDQLIALLDTVAMHDPEDR
ncbi:MAG TPA: hypothetical protein VN613_06930, partial [Gemmatimonadaceae bacterium]|nr:hypothetical protein [Gemmatimonadaceae bacterium]